LENAALAVRHEAQLSKDQNLELYHNEVYVVNGAGGVDQASRRYFGVPPARLTLAQASLLGGLIQAPSADDPFIHATAARMRQADVLTSMVRNGYITISEGTGVMRTPMKLAGGRTLPAQPGTSVSPGPQFSLVPLAAGIALGTLAAAAFAAARKSGLGRWWRAGTLAGCLAGLILLARAFNVD